MCQAPIEIQTRMWRHLVAKASESLEATVVSSTNLVLAGRWLASSRLDPNIFKITPRCPFDGHTPSTISLHCTAAHRPPSFVPFLVLNHTTSPTGNHLGLSHIRPLGPGVSLTHQFVVVVVPPLASNYSVNATSQR